MSTTALDVFFLALKAPYVFVVAEQHTYRPCVEIVAIFVAELQKSDKHEYIFTRALDRHGVLISIDSCQENWKMWN